MKNAARSDRRVLLNTVENRPFPGDRRRDEGDVSKAYVPQHSLNAQLVRTPPIAWILLQLGAGVKHDGWLPNLDGVEHRLHDQYVRADARCVFECEQWMTCVIEHAGEEHKIEAADG